jgi:hypothetical protein
MASVGLSMNNLFLKSKSPPSGKEGSEEERSRRFEGTCVLASENRSSPAKRSVGWTRSTASSACIAGRLRRITRKARECCPGVASAAARWPDMAGSEKLARVETRDSRLEREERSISRLFGTELTSGSQFLGSSSSLHFSFVFFASENMLGKNLNLAMLFWACEFLYWA